jgi:hypothetical protein
LTDDMKYERTERMTKQAKKDTSVNEKKLRSCGRI